MLRGRDAGGVGRRVAIEQVGIEGTIGQRQRHVRLCSIWPVFPLHRHRPQRRHRSVYNASMAIIEDLEEIAPLVVGDLLGSARCAR